MPGPFVPEPPGPGGREGASRLFASDPTGHVFLGPVYVPPGEPPPGSGGRPETHPGTRGRERNAWAGTLGPSVPRVRLSNELRSVARAVPDFPREGARFWDVTPLLQSPGLFRRVVTALAEEAEARGAEAIAGIDPRGILLAPAVALRLAVPFVPVAAPGTLPGATASAERREQGAVPLRLAVQRGRIAPGQRVAVLDDILVTGATASTAAGLLEELGGIVAGIGVVAEVRTGRSPRTLGRYNVFSLLTLSSLT